MHCLNKERREARGERRFSMLPSHIPPLQVGKYSFKSRLLVGTGKYPDMESMKQAFLEDASDLPKETALAMFEMTKQAFLNGGKPEDILEHLFGGGMKRRNKKRRRK